MALQLNPYTNKSHELPLTITPVLPANHHNAHFNTIAMHEQPKTPDLTFHCMCCEEYFVNPYHLYQHMNSKHPPLPEAPAATMQQHNDNEEDEVDYSWVLEPVCELVDLDEPEANNTHSDSDSDSDDDSTSSSTSSVTTTSTDLTNSNSLTRDDAAANGEEDTMNNLQATHQLAEFEGVSTSSNSASVGASAAFPVFNLKTADPRESTSIILLNSSGRIADNAYMPTTSLTPVVRPGRGRRSAAFNAEQLAAFANGEQKCFQCTHCEVSFQNAGDLSKHVRSHITNKPFQCSICEKTFTHIGSLNTHIRIHSGEKPYKCELCAKAFTQSSSLMVHVRSHSIKKPHQCHLCDKGFVNSSSLLLHLKSHQDIEIFNCPECDKQFKQQSMLEKHMRMHTQQLVYQCSICRFAFRSSSELVQHMKCHMGEKPFTCSICDRSFTQSGSLGIHMRIHTGEKPFQCKLCDKAFTQASSLSVHMKIHSGEKPFPCHICGKSYSQQAYLNKHIQGHLDASSQSKALVGNENAPPQETLLCIVCGALHKDAASLALHVTREHAVLLSNIKDAQAQMQVANVSEEERRRQQEQYMNQLQLMLRTSNGNVLPQLAMNAVESTSNVEVKQELCQDDEEEELEETEEPEDEVIEEYNEDEECDDAEEEDEEDATDVAGEYLMEEEMASVPEIDDYGAEEEVETEE